METQNEIKSTKKPRTPKQLEWAKKLGQQSKEFKKRKAELSKKSEQAELSKKCEQAELNEYFTCFAGLVICGAIGYFVYKYKNNETIKPPIQNKTEQRQVVYPKHFQME